MGCKKLNALDFISNGKLAADNAVITFEGWEVKGDKGSELVFNKTSSIDTPSQTPIERNSDSFTDSEGYVYEVAKNCVFMFSGLNKWFPYFEDAEIGLYAYTESGWIPLSQLIFAEYEEYHVNNFNVFEIIQPKLVSNFNVFEIIQPKLVSNFTVFEIYEVTE